MRLAYSYRRFSTQEQRHGNSLSRQSKWEVEWIAKHPDVLLDDSLTFEDLGKSGFHGDNLKEGGGLKFFLDCCDAKRVKVGSFLIVESLDRLTRLEIDEALELFLSILRRGITIVTTEGEFDKANLKNITPLLVAIIQLIRGNQESARKRQFTTDNWEEKRAKLHEEKATKRIPAWLKMADDRKSFHLISERVQVVRQIFTWASEGLGITAIVKRLNAEKIAPIGLKNCWAKSSVTKMLHARTVLGEYQPHKGRGWGKRTPIGPPVVGYYPPIISEAVFYRVQDALKRRQTDRGPKGKNVRNLFTGLARDARDKTTFEIVDKGAKSSGPQIVSFGARRGQTGSVYVGFPYATFEYAILRWFRELDPSELLERRPAAELDLSAAEDKIAALDRKIVAIKKKIESADDCTPLLDMVVSLDKDRKATAATIERLKAESQNAASSDLNDVRELLERMDEMEDDELRDLRLRLKAKIRRLVNAIWVLLERDGKNRTAFVQVHLTNGLVRRLFIQWSPDRTFVQAREHVSGFSPWKDAKGRPVDLANWTAKS
jgi:DNA invertase Pin-like site-specific DNA recombinase